MNAKVTNFEINGVSLPPGIKGHKHAFALGESPFKFLKDNRDQFGKAFTLGLPGRRPLVIVSDADELSDLMKLPGEAFDRLVFVY